MARFAFLSAPATSQLQQRSAPGGGTPYSPSMWSSTSQSCSAAFAPCPPTGVTACAASPTSTTWAPCSCEHRTLPRIRAPSQHEVLGSALVPARSAAQGIQTRSPLVCLRCDEGGQRRRDRPSRAHAQPRLYQWNAACRPPSSAPLAGAADRRLHALLANGPPPLARDARHLLRDEALVVGGAAQLTELCTHAACASPDQYRWCFHSGAESLAPRTGFCWNLHRAVLFTRTASRSPAHGRC